MGEPSIREIRARLLVWYEEHRRDLPWRRTQDPYRILVAEYLLQRTRIASGTPYYERFLARFPTIRDLAAAPLDDVLAVWEGLGFYGRARNLHAAAKAVVERFGGAIPRSYNALSSLPGMGPYTAGAVSSIAFGVPVPAVDGNVTRVIARLYRIHEDVGKGVTSRRIREIAGRLVSPENPGAFNQAMMELGATVCAPSSPACGHCPLERLCLARGAGEERELPWAPKRPSVRVVPVVFALVEADGHILLVRRPPGTLLGGLWSLPGGETTRSADRRHATAAMVRDQADVEVAVLNRLRRVDRRFSHRKWSGSIYRCAPIVIPEESPTVRWVRFEEALRLPLVPFHREAIEAFAGGRPFSDR